jgi:S-adenosylmethionine decarboxylase
MSTCSFFGQAPAYQEIRMSTHKAELEVGNGGQASAAGAEDPVDFFTERDGVRYAGVHLIIDLWGGERLDDLAYVEATILNCVEAAGATLLNIELHHLTPNNGVAGVAMLKESHISIHTWPEDDYAAVDIFMCGNAEPDTAVEVLREAFPTGRLEITELLRGQVPKDRPQQAHRANPCFAVEG